MRDVQDLRQLSAESGAAAFLTIGNFDGVHRGHRAIFSELTGAADAAGGISVAATFQPHPLSVVAPDLAPGLLSPKDEKRTLIEAEGVDALVVVSFTRDVAASDARSFLKSLGVGRGTHLVLGYDFRMGRDRACDVRRLSALGEESGFGLDVVPPVEHGGIPISSTRIREALGRGDVIDAEAMLGRPYEIRGAVEPGAGLGAGLGAPTANLAVDPAKLVPADGVYLVEVTTLGGRPGLAYVGRRPTFEGRERGVEVHVLDFDGDLAGGELAAAFRRRRRGDERLPTEEALRARIEEDIAWARDAASEGAA